jgi:hypothetical protein
MAMRDLLERFGPPGARANAAAEAARRHEEEIVAEALAARVAARDAEAERTTSEPER